jgi:hypothetical protein
MSDAQLTIPEAETALAATQAPNVPQMMHDIIKGGVTTDNVAALEKVIDLYERMETRNAEKAFNAAFVALQQELPVIVATTIIPNRGKYERFEDVSRVVNPLLFKHGFTVSFSMQADANRVTETCILRHIGGYSQSNSFSVRAGGKADSETQADCKAATTAKRNALLNCLNIVIRQDAFNEENDDTQDGAPISWEQVAFLKEQVKETGADEAAFLRFAGVHDYHEIGTARYDSLVAALAKKAKR